MKDMNGTELKKGNTVVYCIHGYMKLGKATIHDFSRKMAILNIGDFDSKPTLMHRASNQIARIKP